MLSAGLPGHGSAWTRRCLLQRLQRPAGAGVALRRVGFRRARAAALDPSCGASRGLASWHRRRPLPTPTAPKDSAEAATHHLARRLPARQFATTLLERGQKRSLRGAVLSPHATSRWPVALGVARLGRVRLSRRGTRDILSEHSELFRAHVHFWMIRGYPDWKEALQWG